MSNGSPWQAPVIDPPHVAEADHVVQVEMVASKPPGPGFWMAVGCCLMMMGAQLLVGTVAVVVCVVPMIVGGGTPPDPEALEDSLPMPVLIGTATATTLLCALLMVAIVYRRQAPRKLALRNASILQWVAVLLGIVPLSVLASEVTNWVALVVPSFSMGMFAKVAQESLVASLVFGALLAALGEELCFRGFIGRGLVARYGALTGVLVTSLLFGLVHLDPVQASGAMLLGMGIHGAYLATRSLYSTFVIHGLNNAMAFAAFSLQDRLSLPGYIPGADGTPEFTPWPLLLTALASVFGLALVLWDTRTHFVFANGYEWDPGYVTAEQPPVEVQATAQCGRPRILSLIAMAALQAVFIATLLAHSDWTS